MTDVFIAIMVLAGAIWQDSLLHKPRSNALGRWDPGAIK